VRHAEEELISIIREAGVDFTASLPCEKIRELLLMIGRDFLHLPLTREEEGVGICAGAALAGRRPALFVQSSGVGNMINALLSLTGFYRLPLAVFVSLRGVYREKIEAQVPMGRSLPGILEGAGLQYSLINRRADFRLIRRALPAVYRNGRIHFFLLSPALWEGVCAMEQPQTHCPVFAEPREARAVLPRLTRCEMLQAAAPHLDSKAVICNLGFPSKELYSVGHRPSNFYMLGSMGMATPIGLGVSLASRKEVVVIDGDGSLLMNPGSLATAAAFGGKNLVILAIDNGAYGSTGSQPTLTGRCVDLEMVARGFGMRDTSKVSTKAAIVRALKKRRRGAGFIHAVALPGNRDLPPIPLDRIAIRKGFEEFLR